MSELATAAGLNVKLFYSSPNRCEDWTNVIHFTPISCKTRSLEGASRCYRSPHGFRRRRSLQARLPRHCRPLPRTLPATSLSPPATSGRGRSPGFFCRQMVTHGRPSWLLVFIAISFSLPARSAISTSTPTPPLQWLNITQLLSGPSAPPLKGASLGYDETTRTLIVFGGESESGFPTSTTYLYVLCLCPSITKSNAYRTCSLNLDSLIWTVPTPPTGLDGAPPPRSGAINGFDWAANQRQCHLVIGGRDSNGNGLSDVWVRVGKLTLPPKPS